MTNIDFNLLKIFYEVAKEENITRASENLFISQPAVSQSIKKLEVELGGALFNRNNKGLSLTEEGKSFYEYVKRAIEMIENGQDEFVNFKNLKSGKVRIGISTMLAKNILLKPLMAFHKDYGEIKIEIMNGLTKDLIDELEKGNLDVAIFSENINNGKLDSIVIKECHHCFIYNKEFYQFNGVTSLRELEKAPLILQMKKSNTRDMFDCIAQKYNLNFKNVTEVVSQELVKTLAQCGLGVGFFIKEFLDRKDRAMLSTIKLQEHLPKFQIKLAKSSFHQPTFATKKIIEYILKDNKI